MSASIYFYSFILAQPGVGVRLPVLPRQPARRRAPRYGVPLKLEALLMVGFCVYEGFGLGNQEDGRSVHNINSHDVACYLYWFSACWPRVAS